MSVTALLLGLALLLLTLAYLLRPFLTATRTMPAPPPRDQLLAQRAAIYTAIRELDFEYQSGKLAHDDYAAQRQKYVLEGVQVLKSLDRLPADDCYAALSDEIEAAVQAARQKRGAV